MTPFIIGLILLTNAERVAPLKVDPVLMQRAQVRAQFLCDNNQWSHDGWLKSFTGYSGWLGENLAKNFPDATSTNAALMASPTHEANIVASHFHKLGFAHAASCNLTVELFAS